MKIEVQNHIPNITFNKIPKTLNLLRCINLIENVTNFHI